MLYFFFLFHRHVFIRDLYLRAHKYHYGQNQNFHFVLFFCQELAMIRFFSIASHFRSWNKVKTWLG